MSDDGPTLMAVQAARTLSMARDEYARAVLNALESGVSVSVLARELGVSRQAVNQMRLRHLPAVPVVTDEELDKRIAAIERKWEGLVEAYAGQFGSMESDRAQQATLNRQSAAKKARRRTRLSVKGSRLAFAEVRLLQEIRNHSDVPVFRVALEQLAVLDELLQERERRNDGKF